MQSKQNIILFIVVALTVSGILYLLSPILTPFLIAAILTYLTNPIVEKMVAHKVPRILAVIFVFLSLFFLIVLFFVLLVPAIQRQIVALLELIPKVMTWLQDKLGPLLANLGMEGDLNITTFKETLTENWSKAGGAATWLVKTVFHSGLTMIEWLANLLLIPVVTFYLLRDWPKLLKNGRDILPRKIEPTAVKLIKECDEVLSAFFRGQLLVMLSLGIIYGIGLSLIGLQLGIVIGVLAGLMSIVPYLGFIVGIITASVAAFMQFETFTGVLLAWFVFAIGQVLESTVLTPNLVGDRIGLHPVVVIFAVLAGGSLFGFFGVLLALPVAAIIMVWLRFLNHHYRHSQLYQM